MREVTFELASYDASQPLIIDPVLSYSTYLGGSSGEVARSIALDSADNVYLTGETQSTNFPTANPFQANSGGGPDAYVTKLNPSGSALVYSSYLGGSGSDSGVSLALDSAGSAHLTGPTTSTDFPTVSPIQAVFGGPSRDAYVTKVNASGSALVYSTYLGGSGDDLGLSIAVDAAGNAYVTGLTGSPNFPTASPLQPGLSGGSDAFIAKIADVVPAISFSPSNLAFGNQLVGTTSSAQTVTLTNTSTGSVTVSSVTLTGSHPGDFTKTADNCSGVNLAPGGTCTISVSFAPTASGSRSANLTTSHDGVGSPQNVPLSGTGTTDFTLSISPSSVTVRAGQSASYTVTVSPQGGSFDNAVALTCSNLPPLTSCTFSPATLTPSANPATST